MKKHRIFLILMLGLALLLVTTQAFARPAAVFQAQGVSTTRTPGAQATQRAAERTTGQTGNPHGKHENYKGTLSAVDTASLTLTLRNGSSVTIGMDASTRIKFPGPRKAASASLQPGMTVMVQAMRDANGNLVARAVMVIPGKPEKIHRVGIVTAYAAGSSITIQAKDGSLHTFALGPETVLLPAERVADLTVGSRVTIISPRDPATGGFTARGIVIHPAAP